MPGAYANRQQVPFCIAQSHSRVSKSRLTTCRRAVRSAPPREPPPPRSPAARVFRPPQNEAGQTVDLYIPRKCSWTNRLIGASDQASVQINVGTIDPNTGLHTGGSETYALSGYVRNKGESDMALTELVRKADELQ